MQSLRLLCLYIDELGGFMMIRTYVVLNNDCSFAPDPACMISRHSLLIACLLLLTACGDRRGTPATTTTAGDTTAAAQPSLRYHRYKGSIGDKKITAHLLETARGIAGCYYYEGIGEPIQLNQDKDDTGALVLEERAGAAYENLPQWKLPRLSAMINGQWVQVPQNRSYPLHLEEYYPENSYRLDLLNFSDTASLYPEQAEPNASFSIEAIVPYRDMPAAAFAFLESELGKALNRGFGSPVADWEKGMQERAAAYFDDYRKELKEIDGPGGKRLEGFAYNYSSLSENRVLMNGNGWLVLETIHYEYMGGAHGIYGSTFQNLDVSGEKEWGVAEVFSDTGALLPLLDAAARSYFGIAANSPLTERLLADAVPFTDNFYLSPGGISFVYNPYEISSYADGTVRLFLPYARLQPFLTQSFIKRMHLDTEQGMALTNPDRRKPLSDRIEIQVTFA